MKDATLAARLLARDPAGLGGLLLRGRPGSWRDAALAELAASMPVRKLPVGIDDERLTGGLDVAASLAAGRRIEQAGLLTEAKGGALVAASAERLRDATAGRIALALDASGSFALVLLDEGIGADEYAPASLAERVAFHVDAESEGDDASAAAALPISAVAPASDEIVAALAATAAALGVGSIRAHLFALRAARAAAALAGRPAVEAADAALAARLVLAPRATQLPAEPEPPAPEPGDAEREPETGERLDDIVLAAARAALPPNLLELARTAGRGAAARSGAGERRRAVARGRPVGTRQGLPRGGLRLALIDTLRAAAPWQKLRGGVAGERIRLRRDDLRVRRFEDKGETLTIFAVDASGSAALARLAEAKGAVELLLGQAYAKRAEVALIAFRGTGAETLLPPTRSLTRARRLLAELPGGGGTPLAAGIDAARVMAEASKARGRTPFLVLLTDGRANVAANGASGRGAAQADAEAAAKRLAAARLQGVVIDIGARPQPEAGWLAAAMAARYLHLPRADAGALRTAIA